MKLINSYIIKDYFDEEYEVYPVISNKKHLEILLVLTEDEWFCELTVKTNQKQSKKNKALAYVDTNKNPWAEKFITENKIGIPTGFFAKSGNITYPEYRFDLKKLNKW